MRNSAALWSLPSLCIMGAYFANVAGFEFSSILTYLP